MKKILFLIHDLGHGGAEKVLVNLVNHLDPEKFDISVTAIFGGGVNEQFLKPHIRYRAVFPKAFPGNSHVMKLFSPERLHRLCVKERYDIEVSYLEGPSARIISGCEDPDTKLVSWIHSTCTSEKNAAASFRSVAEARHCYGTFHRVVCVSEGVKASFLRFFPDIRRAEVLYNTVESDRILSLAAENAPELDAATTKIKLVCVGKLSKNKGTDRLLRIHYRLKNEGFPTHLYLLGAGPLEQELRNYARENGLEKSVTFLGYQTNPYKYVSRCDLFVCASHAEGFSTAATEALILGTPVCTVEVSGMREMLGDNEYGLITENHEEALYQGIKTLLDDPKLLAHYQAQAALRGKKFSTVETVKAVEQMLLNL